MAALDFPASPTLNQVFNASNGAAYQWDGEVWKIATDTGSPIVISADPPASPVVGQLWWRNDPDGSMFLYYDDGTSKQFVPAVSYTGGPSGPAGGSLSGTYPNPSIAIGATTPAYGSVGISGAINIASATETIINTIPSFVTHGGRVLLALTFSGMVNAPSTSPQSLALRVYRDSTLLLDQGYSAILSSAALGWLPVNYAVNSIGALAAGTYALQARGARTQGDATWQITYGSIWALELA